MPASATERSSDHASLAFVLGELQVGVVHGQQPRLAEQRERNGQPQGLQALQVAYAGTRTLGQGVEVEADCRQGALQTGAGCRSAAAARLHQGAQRSVEPPLEQHLFTQLLDDRQGRLQVRDTGYGAQRGDAAYGCELPRQPVTADLRVSGRRASYGPSEPSSRQVRPEPEGPFDRDERAGRCVDVDVTEDAAARAVEPEALSGDPGAPASARTAVRAPALRGAPMGDRPVFRPWLLPPSGDRRPPGPTF